MSERPHARTRVCVNLGPDKRAFLFVPFAPRSISKSIVKDLAGVNRRSFFAQFFFANPSTPVLRLVLAPGEAYFADTDNLIHDGCTTVATRPTTYYTVRGRFAAL